MLLLLNAATEPVTFTTAALPAGFSWEVILDTTFPDGDPGTCVIEGGDGYELADRSLAVLCQKQTVQKQKSRR
jgi:hypothetical protein